MVYAKYNISHSEIINLYPWINNNYVCKIVILHKSNKYTTITTAEEYVAQLNWTYQFNSQFE
jgi:hypothetical protein